MICNANVTIDQARSTPLLRPKHAGRYWQGIPHTDLIDGILDECQGRRWKVLDTQFSLSADGADLAGAFRLEIRDVAVPEGQALELGFLHSNAMRRPLTIVSGTRVFICHNGMVSGEHVLRHKHTSGFSLLTALEDGLDRYHTAVLDIPRQVTALQQRELAPVEVEHLLVEAGRQNLMPWSRIGQVDEEFRHPTFRDHAVPTSWGLLNAFTHIVKKCPPLTQMDQIDGFRKLLPVHGSN